MSKLHAITVHRPWGHAIAYLGKDIENRNWECPLPAGSYLAIHNGKKWDEEGAEFVNRATPDPVEKHNDPAGCIVAIAQFAGNVEESDSPWFFGEYGWKLENVVAIAPVPCRGQQGLWVPSEGVLHLVRFNYREALKLKNGRQTHI